MKVAHLLRKYDPREWGGTESAVLQLLVGLRQNDVESVVFAPTIDEVGIGEDPFADTGFPVKRFSAFLPVLGISRAERARRTAIGGNLVSLTAPFALAREPGVSVIHSHVLGYLGGVGRRAAQARRVPFVVTIHGGYLDLPPAVRGSLAPSGRSFEYGKAFGLLVGARSIVARADVVITCNPREADLLEERGTARRVARMPHGIQVAAFADDRRADAEAFLPVLAGDRTALLCVGRIDSVKNQAFVLERMPEVLRAHPDALLVLAGPVTDPAHEREIREAIAAHGLEERVLLPGPLPPGDRRLIGLYQRASVLVLPSRSETFGLVLLEAWSAGTPVLSTPTSGARQVIDDGVNGILFDTHDPASFHRGLDRLLDAPDDARAMVERGRALARDCYDTATVARQFVDLYQELLCAT